MRLERLARRQRLEAEVAGAGAWRRRGLVVRVESHGGARLARRKRWGSSEEVGLSEGARWRREGGDRQRGDRVNGRWGSSRALPCSLRACVGGGGGEREGLNEARVARGEAGP